MRKYSSRLDGAVRGRTSSMNSSKFSHFCRNFTVTSSLCAIFALICALAPHEDRRQCLSLASRERRLRLASLRLRRRAPVRTNPPLPRPRFRP